MSRTIRIVNDYPRATPEALWRIAKDFRNLAPLSDGSVEYRGLPPEPVQQGDVVDFEVRAMKRQAWRTYRVTIVELDDEAHRYVTQEQGSGVKSWRHELTIQPYEDGARQIDEVEVEAGWLTWAVALLARRMYRKRHAARLALLGQG